MQVYLLLANIMAPFFNNTKMLLNIVSNIFFFISLPCIRVELQRNLSTPFETKLNHELVWSWNEKNQVISRFNVGWFFVIIFQICFHTAQKIKFSSKEFFSKCDQIRRKATWDNYQFCEFFRIQGKRLVVGV